MEINELIDESYATAKEKQWWKEERNFMELLMLVVTEISEAAEEYRRNGLDPTRFIYREEGLAKPEGITVELADAVIRIADLCGKYNMPLELALRTKLDYNKTRPPRHGGKLA